MYTVTSVSGRASSYRGRDVSIKYIANISSQKNKMHVLRLPNLTTYLPNFPNFYKLGFI